jgi:hypothetical protein
LLPREPCDIITASELFEKPQGRRQMKARAIIAILLLGILLASSIACGGGTPESPLSRIGPTPDLPSIEVRATLSQIAYLAGEEVRLEFSAVNTDAEPVTIRSSPPEIEVRSMESHKDVRVFPPGYEQVTLAPGETMTYTFVWDQTDSSGQQVLPGEYRISVLIYVALEGCWVLGWESPTARWTAGGATVFIQYPQGAMEKSIAVNQSQTADDLTITIERVELSAAGCEIYAFTTPPNFDPSQGPPGPPPQRMIASAQYSVDGGPQRDAGNGGSNIREDGLKLFWRNLDPIPSDAEVLIFTITGVELLFVPTGPGQWSGPWEFEISLH